MISRIRKSFWTFRGRQYDTREEAEKAASSYIESKCIDKLYETLYHKYDINLNNYYGAYVCTYRGARLRGLLTNKQFLQEALSIVRQQEKELEKVKN
tara:strand:- start:1298 stop:1588 length:291 start_codon:yes stop_codon:yes gene_type:complete